MSRYTLLAVSIALLLGLLLGVTFGINGPLISSPTSENREATKAFAVGRFNRCIELLANAESPHDVLLRAKANLAKATAIHLENEKEPIVQYLELAAKDCNRIADELFDQATEQQRAEAAAVKRIATKQLAIYRP